jgi:hypothetical protein
MHLAGNDLKLTAQRIVKKDFTLSKESLYKWFITVWLFLAIAGCFNFSF